MGLISAASMIRSISLFHITLGILLLKNPKLIADQSIVLILGQSMQLPIPREFQSPSASISFLAILFAFIGVSDLTAISMNEEIVAEYWGNATPIRLLFLFSLTAYTYMTKEGGMFASRGNNDFMLAKGNNLNNGLMFTWGFLEMASWFWVYTTLREERREKARNIVESRKREADRL